MAKAWDLVGIKRETKKTSTVFKKRSKGNCLFFVFVVAVFFVSAFFFSQADIPGFTSSAPAKIPSPTLKPSKSATATLKIINGSGRFEETEQISKLIKAVGFVADATETAPSLYNQTIVYYNPGYESEAARIVTSLQDVSVKAQPFTNKSSYDLAIVIGAK